MITDVTQRWKGGRVSYHPAGEAIRTTDYDVWRVWADDEVKAFTLEHHYAGSYPAARQRFGLWRKGQLVGVAIFSHPTNDATLTGVFPGDAAESIELGRLVLLDQEPCNCESFFVGECLRVLKKMGIIGVVSFSDPVPRWNGDELVLPGHAGIVYMATNALYLGRATPRTLHTFADGTVFSARTEQKIRAKERGWGHAVEQLVKRGASAPPDGEAALLSWLRTWKARLTTRSRHGGNLKYVFPLGGKAVERHVRRVATVKRYPKAERGPDGALLRIIEA